MRLFSRRERLDDFLEAIRPEFLTLQTPEPTQALRNRIVASRREGVRTLLPNVTQRPTTTRRSMLAIAIAAVATLLLVPAGLQRSPFQLPGSSEASDGFLGAIAYAQPVRSANSHAVAPIKTLAPARLHSMSLEFARSVHDGNGRIVSDSRITLDVVADSISNLPAWRMISRDQDTKKPGALVSIDTTYIARSDLRLLHRSIHVAPFSGYRRVNVWQRFSRDSIIGRMNTAGPDIGSGRSFARRLPSAFKPYLTNRTAPVVLMSVRLSPDMRGSASVLGWAVRDDDVVYPIELHVEGEEAITVPAGTFECWRLSLSSAGRQLSYWARKSDGLGIRVFNPHDSPNRTREVVLVRER